MNLAALGTLLLLQLLSIQSVALQEAASALKDAASLPRHRRSPGLPRGGKVAVVLRGQSSRCRLPSGRVPCSRAALPEQELATFSLLQNVIQPLEARGNDVRVVVTDGECGLTSNLTSLLERGRRSRIVRVKQQSFAATSATPQSGGLRFALETLKGAVPGGSEEIARGFDLVLLLRHDTAWKMPIDAWPDANFSRLNAASRCEETAPYTSCLNDMIFAMPGRLFPAFDAEVGTKHCFSAAPGECQVGVYCSADVGHTCTEQLRSRVGAEHFGFLTKWRPTVNVRQSNEIWETYDVLCGPAT